MKIVEILLRVSSVEDARNFYCNELNLFSFYYDFGMETISLTYKNNPSFRLTLSEGNISNTEHPVFSLEIDSCDEFFKHMQKVEHKTKGKLISKRVFEYPLGKNFLVKDPSENKFLIVENYYPNLGE